MQKILSMDIFIYKYLTNNKLFIFKEIIIKRYENGNFFTFVTDIHKNKYISHL